VAENLNSNHAMVKANFREKNNVHFKLNPEIVIVLKGTVHNNISYYPKSMLRISIPSCNFTIQTLFLNIMNQYL